MSTSVTSVVSHFPTAQNGFTTTTAGTVSSGAGTVTLNSVAGYTNGEPVVLVIDPTDAAKKQTFTGIIDTSGVQVTSVVWTAGTNQSHALGATVVDYATATHIAMMSKGIKVNHTQKGNHKTLTDDNANEWIKQTSTASAVNEITVANAATGTGPTISATGDDTNIDLNLTAKGTGQIKYAGRNDAWNTGVTVPNTVTCNGNRSYDLVINSTDLTGYLSAGMRLRTTRTSAAPTQCADLESSSSHYFSRASASVGAITFTDDFVVSAWIKLESYAAMSIASRFNGTSGWRFIINSSGQLTLQGFNAGGSNLSYVISYQSVPLNKWVHVAAQLDMSTFTATTTTSYIMIDGVDVPASVARGGTNPTALVQAGNLEIGSNNAAEFFDGKIAQVALYSAKVTQANIRATISQGLTGSETSLLVGYSFNGVVTDLSSNAYTLTANNSATATNADSPFGGQADGTISSTLDYAIITKAAFSTNTTLSVVVPEGCTIPTTGGVSAMAYSTQRCPYGMPAGLDPYGMVLGMKRFLAASNTITSTASGGEAVLGYTHTFTTPSFCRSVRATLFIGSGGNGTNVNQIWIHNGSISGTTNSVFQYNYITANGGFFVQQEIPVLPDTTYTFLVACAVTAGSISLSAPTNSPNYFKVQAV